MNELGVYADMQPAWFYKDADAMQYILGDGHFFRRAVVRVDGAVNVIRSVVCAHRARVAGVDSGVAQAEGRGRARGAAAEEEARRDRDQAGVDSAYT